MRLIVGLVALVVAANPRAQPAHAEPAMWVAHGPQATVYVLGSIPDPMPALLRRDGIAVERVGP